MSERSRWTGLLVLLGLLFAQSASATDRPVGAPFETRSEVLARHGMAATSQPLATQAAIEILRAGGSAVDAAIAANAVQGVVEPMGCGIGGDLFALVWDTKEGRLVGLNASGPAPMGLSLEQLRKEAQGFIPPRGPLSVSVPGAVDGWVELHSRYGRLPMARVLEPAIRYAREGFPVSEVIAWAWRIEAERLASYAGFAEIFMPGGREPGKGALFSNPRLADTLERIGAGGRAGFYEGETAEQLVAFHRANGGYLSTEDLANYHSEWVAPISTNYRGYDVWSTPPNSQGLAALQMLNILERFDLRAMGAGSADLLHTLIEAKKLAFEDRARWYADPAFAEVPIEALLSKEYAAKRAALIDPLHASTRPEPGNPIAGGDTIYLSVADESGMMVSLIQSNFSGFGSGLTPPTLGFPLQNRASLFSLDSTSPNVYAPGKRPFHTIMPGFVTKEGKPLVSLGVMGGDMQPQGLVQVLVNLIDFGMDLQEAGDAPRFYHSGSAEPTGRPMVEGGGLLSLERGYGALREELAKRGHKLNAERANYGGYQAVEKQGEIWVGASESRKDGAAAGY